MRISPPSQLSHIIYFITSRGKNTVGYYCYTSNGNIGVLEFEVYLVLNRFCPKTRVTYLHQLKSMIEDTLPSQLNDLV